MMIHCSDQFDRSLFSNTSHFPLVLALLHAFHYFLCINSCGRYQFQNLLAEAALVLNIASQGSNKHLLFRQTRMHESQIPSYYLSELARSNAASINLDKDSKRWALRRTYAVALHSQEI